MKETKTEPAKAVRPKPQRIEAALLAARGEFRPIMKTGRNHFLKKDGKDYEYATFDDILRSTEQALADHGLIVIQAPDGKDMMLYTRVVQVETGDYLEDGGTPICSKNAADPQSYAAGLGWAKRLGISTLLGIRTGADDDNAQNALGF